MTFVARQQSAAEYIGPGCCRLFHGLTIDLVKVVLADGQALRRPVDEEVNIVRVFGLYEINANVVRVRATPCSRESYTRAARASESCHAAVSRFPLEAEGIVYRRDVLNQIPNVVSDSIEILTLEIQEVHTAEKRGAGPIPHDNAGNRELLFVVARGGRQPKPQPELGLEE